VRDIRVREHGQDAGDSSRGRGVDAGEPPMGHVAAHDDGMTLAGQRDVAHIPPASGDESQILATADGRAHEGLAKRWRDGCVYPQSVHTYNRGEC